jgi:hypothetical protein
MFHWIDLIAPIGISGLAVLLCIWGFRSAKKTEAKAVCVLTAIAFCASIPALYMIRWNNRKADYTVENVRVRQGKVNRCEREQVAADVVWVKTWWQSRCPDKKAAVARKLDDILLICVDVEKIGVAGRWVRGFMQANTIIVGWNGDPTYTQSLRRHELSHFAAVGCGYPLDEQEHHALFKKLKLGY